ncbi:MAG: hypothetical protein J0L61_09345 [Planctomycetes bacterium]|nr:hypothetical protein [Planctomycetota bacterium]
MHPAAPNLLATLVPLWAAAPVAAVLMLAVATHAVSIGSSDHPASRKRIRQANGALILLVIPLITAGVSVLDPTANPREWTLVWLAVFALLGIIVTLAVTDVLNTLRLARTARRAMHRRLASPTPASSAAPEPHRER